MVAKELDADNPNLTELEDDVNGGYCDFNPEEDAGKLSSGWAFGWG